MLCELCGKKTTDLEPCVVEGTKLMVCSACTKFGSSVHQLFVASSSSTTSTHTKQVQLLLLQQRRRKVEYPDVYERPEAYEELRSNYSELIRKARERRGWTQKELGMKLGERQSVIAKLETGAIHPDDKLVRKLERLLELNLRVPITTAATATTTVSELEVKTIRSSSKKQKQVRRELTLGELIAYETLKKEIGKEAKGGKEKEIRKRKR